MVTRDSIRNDKIFTIKQSDIEHLYTNIENREDVTFQNQATSTRHRGLTPIMNAILSMIRRGQSLARTVPDRNWIGMSLFELQNVFQRCNISTDTIKDNCIRLAKLKILKQFRVNKGGKKSNKTLYYDFNNDFFPCRDGTWLVEEKNGINFFPIICYKYPFCSGRPTDCIAPRMLKKIRNNITDDYLTITKQNLKRWSNEYTKTIELEETLQSLLFINDENEPNPYKYYNELNFLEKNFYCTLLLRVLNTPEHERGKERERVESEILEEVKILWDEAEKKRRKKNKNKKDNSDILDKIP